MKLEDYLKGIRESSDKSLDDEFGVYDNFAIIVKSGYEDIINDVVESDRLGNLFLGKYKLDHKNTEHNRIWVVEESSKVEVQMVNSGTESSRSHPQTYDIHGVPSAVHYNKQKSENYQMHFIIHPKNSPDMTEQFRDIANTIEDITAYLLEKDYSFCFPNSAGRLHEIEKNFSRVVYHPEWSPEVEGVNE